MDGGATWTLSETNPDKDGFYDALAFWDRQNGLALVDPVAGRFVVRVTSDGGATWRVPEGLSMPAALPNEGAFAASGTCLFALQGGQDAWLVTGGASAARVFHTRDRGRTWSAANTPAPSGNASFSVSFRSPFSMRGAASPPAATTSSRTTRASTASAPRTGSDVDTGAAFATGFYSAVVPIPGAKDELAAVGLAGEAVSRDAGRTWTRTGDAPMNAVAFGGPSAGWAVGPKGSALRSAKR